jgi:hypothetical protein
VRLFHSKPADQPRATQPCAGMHQARRVKEVSRNVRPISVPDKIGISYVHVGYKGRKEEHEQEMSLAEAQSPRRRIEMIHACLAWLATSATAYVAALFPASLYGSRE